MSKTHVTMRNVLHQYDRQLITARRLACYHQALRLVSDEAPVLPVAIKRKVLVERVAKKIFENLLFTGNDTPMVQEVQKMLIEEFGDEISFQYPPGSLEMVILKKTRYGVEEVSPSLRMDILARAWIIILTKVDETML